MFYVNLLPPGKQPKALYWGLQVGSTVFQDERLFIFPCHPPCNVSAGFLVLVKLLKSPLFEILLHIMIQEFYFKNIFIFL